MDSPFLSTTDVAGVLGVTRERVAQLVRAGLLPHVRRGRKILVPRAAWHRWLASQSQQALEAVKPAATEGGHVSLS